MKIRISNTEIEISMFFVSAFTLFLIFGGIGAVFRVFSAIVIHEAGHLICMFAFGESPQSVEIKSFGVRIKRCEGIILSYGREVAVYLAGPAVNLVAAAVLYLFGKDTIGCAVNLSIALFNLLPAGRLDGGNVLRAILQRELGLWKGKKVCNIVSVLIIVPILILGAILAVKFYSPTLLISSSYLFITEIRGQKAPDA